MDLSFLKANRFWVLVIGCLGVAAEGGFTQDAWIKALGLFAGGFITVRTVDRLGENLK